MKSKENDKEKIIGELFERGILINKELLDEKFDEIVLERIETEADLLVLNSDYVGIICQQGRLIDWYDIDKFRVDAEKNRNDELYQNELQQFKTTTLTFSASSSVKKQEISKQEISGLELSLDEEESGENFSIKRDSSTENAFGKISSSSELGRLGSSSKASFESPANSTDANSTEIALFQQEAVQSSCAVTIVVSYKNVPHKYSVEDFSHFFVSRYRFLEGILRNRQELRNIMNINRLLVKKDRETVSAIGVVGDINETKTGNIIMSLEDLTGKIKVIFSKNKKELFIAAKDVVLDEVVGISGICNDRLIFADNIVWPDIPDNELKKGENEEYLIFLSDIHVGSSLFLKEEFDRFLRWINGETGNEMQKNIAKNVKYVFIGGDVVDGVGVYPSQEDELEIKDINGQYNEFCRLIKKIPSDKKIIICPGNHDVVYLAEPQPILYQEFAYDLFELPNVTLVTNPAMINIGKTSNFSGFDVLLYHGYSFDYYVANVESIRVKGGYRRSDLIMKFLLKRRHLAPSFTSTPYYPSHKEDPLLIKKIPDFFLTGHIHYSGAANYKGVTMISGSCWQGKTSFQEKLGHEPEPARVPAINLKTREVRILRFG